MINRLKGLINFKIKTLMTLKWKWEDGWILMSLCIPETDNYIPLDQVIQFADCINHDIPSAKELSTSLTKFLQISLIEQIGNQYKIKDPYRQKLKNLYRQKGGLTMGLLETSYFGLHWLESLNLSINQNAYINLSDEEVHQAYLCYTKRNNH